MAVFCISFTHSTVYSLSCLLMISWISLRSDTSIPFQNYGIIEKTSPTVIFSSVLNVCPANRYGDIRPYQALKSTLVLGSKLHAWKELVHVSNDVSFTHCSTTWISDHWSIPWPIPGPENTVLPVMFACFVCALLGFRTREFPAKSKNTGTFFSDCT